MYEHKHCQMQTDEGLKECGFLIGSKCMKDPNRPFFITIDVHKALKIVGCASWSKYMEYDNGRTDKV